MLRRPSWYLLASLLSGAAAPVVACPLALPERAVTVAERPLTVEIAATPQARDCGLSQRDRLAPGHGMLFVFDAPVNIPFWMKDTRMPLSIAFLDADGRILALADMAPHDTRLHRPDRPYRYALEVNLGWFARHGIGPGDRVRFTLPGGD